MLETETRRRRVFTWLMWAFALPVPIGVMAVLGEQVARTGNVSHWPWEEYGFAGWWLVPASLWVGAACSLARDRERPQLPTTTKVLGAVAVVTTLALLFNP